MKERQGSLTRLMEFTDSVMCRRLISVSSLQRGKGGSGPGSLLASPHSKAPSPNTYTSFLCFSFVLASEILLLRFLSRIF